jgi:hypothetical protein
MIHSRFLKLITNYLGVYIMRKLIATVSTILIASALFAVVAPSGPQFSLNAQVDGILFHGFTTEEYSSSDDILAAQNNIEKEAFVKGLDLTSDAAQDIGYYSFYSTNLEQTSISFKMDSLSATVLDQKYYVPYTLNYSVAHGNNKISLSDGVIEAKAVATLTYPGSVTENVLKTKQGSTGLRYGILNLSVEFEGTKNISFGLPQVNDDNYYSGTITALIDAK